MSTETEILIKRAAAELKTAGAREIYAFGSAAKGTGDAASDLDLAVSGLPAIGCTLGTGLWRCRSW